MNLETKWLEDFVALANTRSFSASARQRHVTQPAFSRRIRALEQAVGVTLVDRSTTPINLTPEGQLFLVTARNLVEQLNECLGICAAFPGRARRWISSPPTPWH